MYKVITFILPGYSPKNKDWALETAKNLKLNHEIRPVLWEHWTEPEKKFLSEPKADDLIDVILKDNCNIVAKSIGTLVLAYVVQKIPNRVEKVILCGIPINDLREENKEVIKTALKNFPPEKIICFQNESDPHGSFSEVKKFLSEVNPEIKIISKPRSDHEYPYFTDFQETLHS